MTSIRSALEEAAFALVNVPAVTSLAPVVQHVLEDSQPPLVIVADISMAPIGGKDGGLYLATISFVCIYRGTEGTAAAEIVDAVEAALLGGTLSASGMAATKIHSVTSDGPSQGEDGVTYDGTVTAEAIVQPA